MPAISRAQQRLFGLVRGLQKGKVSAASVSPHVRKLARNLTPADVEKYSTTPHTGLPSKIKEILDVQEEVADLYEDVNEREMAIQKILKDKTANKIDGKTVDGFTAKMIVDTCNSLSPDNRKVFLMQPIDKMVGIAHKIKSLQNN